MKKLGTFLSLAFSIFLIVGVSTQALSHNLKPTSEVLLRSQVEWSPLNPARGDASPQAGNLWGDRTSSGATGFLVKFVDGFSSPPHIHNVTYRGVAIDGLIHNDDPDAEKMWMPEGSFWTQPAGEAHITAAMGNSNMAYIEIDSGPYLVNPADEAFDNGEKPINVDPSNIVWLDASNFNSSDHSKNIGSPVQPQVAFLWGDPQDREPYGAFIKLPAGFKGEIRNYSSTFRAVVVRGQPQLLRGAKADNLEPGSYFGSMRSSVHQIGSQTTESVLYVRTRGKFDVMTTQN